MGGTMTEQTSQPIIEKSQCFWAFLPEEGGILGPHTNDRREIRPHRVATIFQYGSLLYSLLFFRTPVQSRSIEGWCWFACFYILFFAFYLTIPHTSGRIQIGLLTGLFLLGFAYFPFGVSAAGVFVFPAVMLTFVVLRTEIFLYVLGTQAAIILLETWLLHLPTWAAENSILFSAVIGLSYLTYAQQHRANALLARANVEIEQLTQAAERERISRDLHDLLGHTLTLVTVKLNLVRKLLPVDSPQLQQEVVDAEQTARRALAEVREAVEGYRADGLSTEIARSRRMLAAAGVQLTTSMAPLELTPSLVNVLCLVLREASTNIARHAQARRCHLELRVRGTVVQMTLDDDGVGGKIQEGNGLRGMRERVSQLGGKLMVLPGEVAGLVLRIDLPDGVLQTPEGISGGTEHG
jgi:two-component system sensor histidine kinase DesK